MSGNRKGASDDLDDAYPGRAYLRLSPEVTVARPALGLTVYVHDPRSWAREGALAMLQSFLQFVPPGALRYFTTSMIMEWRLFGKEGLRAVADALSVGYLRGRLRHLFEFRACDDPEAPAYGFRYREVDPARACRTSFIEMTLPHAHEPGDLLQLALMIGNQFPFCSGVGGYVASWNEQERATALSEVFRWCCRYVGLDVQDPDRMAWSIEGGLPGISWINMFGRSLTESREFDVSALARQRWRAPEIAVMSLGQGTLVRAGAAPELGDLNRLEFPHGYAEVARALQALMLEVPPDLSGPFAENDAGLRWYRRLIEPEGWS